MSINRVDQNDRKSKCIHQMECTISPKLLKSFLGEPSKTSVDHFRVTGEYTFAVNMFLGKASVKYVTISDHEQTSVFGGSTLPTVEQFWKLRDPVNFRVYAQTEREAFIVKCYLENACKFVDKTGDNPLKENPKDSLSKDSPKDSLKDSLSKDSPKDSLSKEPKVKKVSKKKTTVTAADASDSV
jgi:hypothetical protein